MRVSRDLCNCCCCCSCSCCYNQPHEYILLCLCLPQVHYPPGANSHVQSRGAGMLGHNCAAWFQAYSEVVASPACLANSAKFAQYCGFSGANATARSDALLASRMLRAARQHAKLFQPFAKSGLNCNAILSRFSAASALPFWNIATARSWNTSSSRTMRLAPNLSMPRLNCVFEEVGCEWPSRRNSASEDCQSNTRRTVRILSSVNAAQAVMM